MDMTFFVFHYLISFLKSIKIKKHQENRCSKNAKFKIIEEKRFKKKVRVKKEGKNTQKTKRDIFLTINN